MEDEKARRRLFAVVFKPDSNVIIQTTREFPESMTANPKPFFPDGYSPENDILQFLQETWDGNFDFMAYGHVRHTRQGDELHDELHLERFKGPPYAPEHKQVWERTCKSLIEETKAAVYEALDEARSKQIERMELGKPNRPADMGIYDYEFVDNRGDRKKRGN